MNIDNIRIISLDLDGTLLNDCKQISPYSEKILKRLQEKGYIIVLNSGRFYHEMVSYSKQLSLENYGGYISCSNGYVVHDMATNTPHTFSSISYDEAQEIIGIARKKRTLTYLLIEGKYHLYAPDLGVFASYFGKTLTYLARPFLPTKLHHLVPRVLDLSVHNYRHVLTYPHLEKICFVGFPMQLKKLQKDSLSLRKDVHFFAVNSCSCEIVKKGVSKADSVAYICERYGYTLENVIAFGDSGNDKPLLEVAGIGIIMKNAKSLLNGCSPHISDETNRNDGVAKYLEKIFL